MQKSYTDFELNVMIKMVGDEDANSGVCVRINPTSFDDAPGYQIDMGKATGDCFGRTQGRHDAKISGRANT